MKLIRLFRLKKNNIVTDALLGKLNNYINEKWTEDILASTILCEHVVPQTYKMTDWGPDIEYDSVLSNESAVREDSDNNLLDLDEQLDEIDESFVQMLLRKIDEKGMTDADCYKKAQLNRSHFNKIKNDPKYHIKKPTIIALALALRLNRDEIDEMLEKAGFALSRSSVFDIIIEFCIENEIYDVFEINQILFAKDQELLGAGIR